LSGALTQLQSPQTPDTLAPGLAGTSRPREDGPAAKMKREMKRERDGIGE